MAADEWGSYRWVWYTAAGAAVLVVGLLALWYWRFPDRSPFVDFAPARVSANGTTAPAPSMEGATSAPE